MAFGLGLGMMSPLRILLRLLQWACCLIALICVSSAFVVTDYYGYTSMLGSSPVTYTQLMTYTGMLYGFWMMLAVWLFGWMLLPSLWSMVLDGLMGLLLLVAAIVLLVSDYVANCGVYGFMLRCRSLNTAVVFTFISMALFFLTLLLNWCYPATADAGATAAGMGAASTSRGGYGGGYSTQEPESGTAYRSETTPTSRFSPKNSPRGSTRV